MNLVKAAINDNKLLTEITIASKSHWGYSEVEIKKWIPELTITSEYLQKNYVYKLIASDKLVGFFAFIIRSKDTIELDFFFVSQKHIGSGYGAVLMNHFLAKVKELKYHKVFLIADPNAETFYAKFGFKVTDYKKSNIIERLLPVMEKTFE